jgi:arsenate reductase
MLKIYHNPRCRQSREGLDYLKQKGYGHEIIHCLHNPLTARQLKVILMKLNMGASHVVRTQEDLYRKELKGKSFTEEEWICIIVQNPTLLQLPIVEGKYKAVIAIPAERIEEVVRWLGD